MIYLIIFLILLVSLVGLIIANSIVKKHRKKRVEGEEN